MCCDSVDNDFADDGGGDNENDENEDNDDVHYFYNDFARKK